MNEEKYKSAIDALTALLQSELASDDRQRFARVHRLTVLAQKLQMEQNPRPEDARIRPRYPGGMGAIGGDDIMGDYEDALMNQQFVGGMMPGGDQNQLVREVLAMIKPIGQGAEAQQRDHEARELNELLKARTQLDKLEASGAPEAAQMKAALGGRLAELVDKIGSEKKDEQPRDPFAMVPALDVRRHPLGAPIGEQDIDQLGRPVADREGGDVIPFEARREALGVEGALADRRHGGPGLPRRADDFDPGADR